MSAISQSGARESEAISPADPEPTTAVPPTDRGNPIQLLRAAIDGLNSSEGGLPDQAQVANLLAEVGQALERANAIARATAECDELLGQHQFEGAFAILDRALLRYPEDPALVKRSRQVAEQQKALQIAAEVRKALEEAEWLVDQNRPDLAAQFLKEKTAALPGQAELSSRLRQLEALLPQWEQDRHEQAALAQAAALEQQQQWQAALTVLEGAWQFYPDSSVLAAAAKRVEDQLLEHEREKKLARRLESIKQKIAEQSWKQAAKLLETTQKEFPELASLSTLKRELEASRRDSECQAIVAEVRQHLADGDTQRAEQVWRAGLQSLGPDPQLEAVRAELEAEEKYREDLRQAQMFFGRHQLQEAERVLAQIVTEERPEARALMDIVRQARAAAEEESFCERGREKALKLMEQQQFVAAADLLRNLLSLFPANAILRRDLMAAQSALERISYPNGPTQAVPREAGREKAPAAEGRPVLAKDAKPGGAGARPSRLRRAAMAGAASLAIASASGAVWKLSHNRRTLALSAASPVIAQHSAEPATAASQSPSPSPVLQPTPETPPSAPRATVQQPVAIAANIPARQASKPWSGPSRPFIPPDVKRVPDPDPNTAMPTPPESVALTISQTPALPSDLVSGVNPPAPPPRPAQPPPPTPAASPIAKPLLPGGGKVEEAQLIQRVMPKYPALARERQLPGVVRVEAFIDEHGAVSNVKIVSGDPILAAAAQAAVRQWKYKPAILNGRPVASSAQISLVFSRKN